VPESPGHGDPASAPPRYAGIRSFARLPQGEPGDADVAIVGAPFDLGVSYRPGARFGPEAIRSASVLLRPYHPLHAIDVFESLRIVDAGDVYAAPGSSERGIGQLAEQLTPIAAAATPLVLGGDHSVALAELRALAAAHGPLALVLLDAHADTWDSYGGERYFHGTPFRRAAEEGLLDPGRSLLAGMRGPLYSSRDLDDARDLGFEIISGPDLSALSPAEYGNWARQRIGDGPVFLSFDIDFIDPAFAPATGTPEAGGPSTAEALALLRALAGIRFSGFDVVEVAPAYDGPGQQTALAAANVAYEMLALAALAD
jgi:agmatinase